MGEQEIELEQENIIITAGGAVNSVNGYTGDVVLTTSDLENTSDYQTGTEVESAISTAIAGKQDTLTAGNNITISNNTISATDTTYTAGTGLDLTGTVFSVDTDTIATKQSVTDEATARENADINLQGQIDAITASSDVKDIVGTHAELEAYDTSTLQNNDIIKVLQDETEDDATTYYRWSTATETFTLIGEEGPYYTKAATDTLLAGKQDTLTAGSNITITAQNEISATDTTYSAGSGLDLTGTTFSVDTTTIQPKLTAGSNITIDANNEISATDTTYTAGTNVSISSGNVISATDTTYSNFVGTDGTAAGTAGLVPAPATTDAGKFLKADGTWDTAGSAINVVQTTGSSTTDVMSQNAVTQSIFASGYDPATSQADIRVQIGGSTASGGSTVSIGQGSQSSDYGSVAIGLSSNAKGGNSVVIGRNSSSAQNAIHGDVAIGNGAAVTGDNSVAIGNNTKGFREVVSLGSSANASAVASVACGQNATASGVGSIALGAWANSSNQGEMNIGSIQTYYGYNNSNYRLLSGVYDPQSAHDAANKEYVDSAIIRSGTAAPTTSTAAAVGALMATVESGTGHLYICTDDTGGTYTWQTLV